MPKKSLIPALPASSRVLDWILIAAGSLLAVTSLLGGGDSGLWIFGAVCIAVGALLLLADRFGSRDDHD